MNKILIGVFCLVALAGAFPSQDNAPTSNLNAQPAQPVIDPVPAGDGTQDVAADGEDGEIGSRHYGGYGGYGGGYGGHHGHGHGGYGRPYGGHGGYGGHHGHGHGGYGRPYGGYGHGNYYG